MTAHRRPLFLSTAAAAALLLPACLSIQTQPQAVTPAGTRDKPASPAKDQARKPTDEFASLRPGTVVPTKPAAGAKDATAARKPNEGAPPAAPPPPNPIKVAGEPPGPFPPVAAAPAEPPLLAVVRAYAEGRPDRAIELLQALNPANQEIILALVPVLAKLAAVDLAADPDAAAALAEQLRAATDRLEPRATLRVESVALCRKVSGFGRYDPWPTGQPHRPNDQAQLYLEVRNLASQPAAGPHGETHLTHARVAVEIRDAHGKLCPQPDPENWQRRVEVVRFEKRLHTRSAVRDFHVFHPFPVPPAPGVYTVTVEVRDGSGRRAARTAPVRFDVAGP